MAKIEDNIQGVSKIKEIFALKTVSSNFRMKILVVLLLLLLAKKLGGSNNMRVTSLTS